MYPNVLFIPVGVLFPLGLVRIDRSQSHFPTLVSQSLSVARVPRPSWLPGLSPFPGPRPRPPPPPPLLSSERFPTPARAPRAAPWRPRAHPVATGSKHGAPTQPLTQPTVKPSQPWGKDDGTKEHSYEYTMRSEGEHTAANLGVGSCVGAIEVHLRWQLITHPEPFATYSGTVPCCSSILHSPK